ncbi:MAG: SynChlorMet cassette radical SAM/SPASM protein ScmF, partial [Deltaproteobacteria bacterium]|nr:SynChlorMet cassette radical SAM/SPASM protein ScmF [Deltaproteobacteria bacterium]
HVPELVFGEAGKDDLASVWANNGMLQALRQGLPGKLKGVCGNCLMNRVCFGSCIAQTYYRTGSLWAPFWFCEEAEKEGLFPITRLRNST